MVENKSHEARRVIIRVGDSAAFSSIVKRLELGIGSTGLRSASEDRRLKTFEDSKS
jgi:hypothetical protein